MHTHMKLPYLISSHWHENARNSCVRNIQVTGYFIITSWIRYINQGTLYTKCLWLKVLKTAVKLSLCISQDCITIKYITGCTFNYLCCQVLMFSTVYHWHIKTFVVRFTHWLLIQTYMWYLNTCIFSLHEVGYLLTVEHMFHC